MSDDTTVTKPAPKKTDPFPTVQLRAFKAMLDLGAVEEAGSVTLPALAKRAKISTNVMRRGIGPTNPDTIPTHEARYRYRCLIGRGMVRVTYDDEAGEYRYHLTALGVKRSETEREAGRLRLGKPHVG